VSLAAAILRLEDDLSSYNPGTKQMPVEGSTDWYRMYASAFALTLLRRSSQLGLSADNAAFARFVNDASVAVKSPLEGVV